jgi:hypothetical protein
LPILFKKRIYFNFECKGYCSLVVSAKKEKFYQKAFEEQRRCFREVEYLPAKADRKQQGMKLLKKRYPTHNIISQLILIKGTTSNAGLAEVVHHRPIPPMFPRD